MKHSQAVSATSILILALAAIGCGQADFSGDSIGSLTDKVTGSDSKKEDTPSDSSGDATKDENSSDSIQEQINRGEIPDDISELPASQDLSLTWACPGDAVRDEAALTTADALTVNMPGAYQLPAAPDTAVNITNSGRFCSPTSSGRDIVFAIDVSNSMRSNLNLGNDRVRKGICGRVTAVAGVLATLDDKARVALVTFDDGVVRDSGGFVSVADLKAKYVNVSVLCEVGDGTKYQPALARVEAILKSRRPSAAAEVYFISDGKPNDGESDGAAEAQRIRASATIATMMLKGNDDILIGSIASKDAFGKPLHGKVDTAEEMADKLKTLAAAKLVSVSLKISDRGGDLIKEQTWPANGSAEFKTEALSLLPKEHMEGVNFAVEYLDSRGAKLTEVGLLMFTPPKE